MKMVLLTTSDYYPQLGGLATFTANIEKVLNDLKIGYEIFHWKNYQGIERFDQSSLSKFSMVINVHSQFCWQSGMAHPKTINFIHGSEVLMTSPNLLKRIYKILNKKNYYQRLERSYFNIFISEATLKKTIETGYSANYARDLILHNSIDLSNATFVEKSLEINKWTFSCIVRDVPHKNLQDSVQFCELVQKITKKDIELIVPKNAKASSELIKISKLKDDTDDSRNDAYKRSQFNLLLSLDHSSKGFFEGFGLTVLESGQFGTPSIVFPTGGLPESVHHLKTGWVISSVSENIVKDFTHYLNESEYQKIAKECYRHTLNSHSLNEYGRLLKTLVETSEAA